MIINFFEYIMVMLLAGAGSFGGGIGGVNAMKEFALSWASAYETTGGVMDEVLNVASFAQYGGYAQGITLAVYLGNKTELGIFGGILGAFAFILPSILFITIILKIGEKLYKSSRFQYSVKYINLLSAGLICVIVWNYAITIFNIDLIYPLITGLACFASIYFRVNPAWLVLGGAVIGVIFRA